MKPQKKKKNWKNTIDITAYKIAGYATQF